MLKHTALALAGLLAVGVASAPQEASAQPWGGGWGHHGWGGHHGGWGGHHGGWGHGGWRHHGGWGGHRWHGGWGPRRVYWGGPRYWRPRRIVVVRPYPVVRAYPVYYRPRHAFHGYGARCVVKRHVGFTPWGVRRFVTKRICYG